ncbi:MAG: 4'-phosphopantetheinyl transferase superfamily protein [Clostridia bacterium]|nr:4'-phosphopantetheinyl transferase superfamily protein [Clostridia bacterium]
MVLIAVSCAHVPHAANILSDMRLQKAAALKNEADQARSLCAGLALDACLRTVGLRERDVTVAMDEHGKPYLADHPDLYFNLSHSGDWAVCALDDAPIGVDLEQHRPIDTERLAKRYLGISEPLTREKIFSLWTKKESYLKAVGVGLSGLHTEPDDNWHFKEYPLMGYSLTVCSQKAVFTPSLLVFSDGDTVPLR